MKMPTQFELMKPTVDALRELGDSGSIHEITEVVIKRMNVPDEVAQELQGSGPQTKLEHRLGWARTRLKHAGLVDNSSRGIWTLTPKGSQLNSNDPDAVSRLYREYRQRKRNLRNESSTVQDDEPGTDQTDDQISAAWREELLAIVQAIPPDAFERLCRRLLRESGFTGVNVTGKSGDGGIDVEGMIRFAGLISFPVMVQCKRYKGSVGPSMVRDFRGAMAGRADRGMLITTGNFTRDAKREATKPGTHPIDLIDGNQLVEKLKELELGVETQMVEQVIVKDEWFKSI